MSKQTPGTLLMIGAFATMVAVITIVGLMILGEFSFSAALVLAGFLSVAVALVLFRGFHAAPLPPPNRNTAIERAAEAEKGKPGPTPFQTTGPGHAGAAAEAAPHGGEEKRGDDETGDEPSNGSPQGAHHDTHVEGGQSSGVTRDGNTLASEDELDQRKGSWRYESGGSGSAAGGGAGASADAMGANVNLEQVGEKPETLDGPRDGQADDLKRINGIGPKIEEQLHHMGVFHFGQIATWSDQELDWVDAHLEGFSGRARRDEWVAQARDLQGGEDGLSTPAVHN